MGTAPGAPELQLLTLAIRLQVQIHVAKGASEREKLKVRRFCKSLAAFGVTKGPELPPTEDSPGSRARSRRGARRLPFGGCF